MSDLAEHLLNIERLCFEVCLNFEEDTISSVLRYQIGHGQDIWNRKNWSGHLTASAIVVDSNFSSCLMMGHKKLGFELAPGGHCDPYERPHEAATRELFEETRISSAELHEWHIENKNCPIDVDTHPIPRNATKGESSHFHHDFRYIFIQKRKNDTILNEMEGTSLRWLPISSIDERYPRIRERMEILT